jgi:folate-binding protein YgfZ
VTPAVSGCAWASTARRRRPGGRDAGRYAVATGIMAMAQGSGLRPAPGRRRFDLFVAPDAAARGLGEDSPLAPGRWARLPGTGSWCVPACRWCCLQTQDHFVPQMANMEILGGVSFNKGCYPGQEIVARSQYLGKVKRRLLPGPSGRGSQARRRTVRPGARRPGRRPRRQRRPRPRRRLGCAGGGPEPQRGGGRNPPQEPGRREASASKPLPYPGA